MTAPTPPQNAVEVGELNIVCPDCKLAVSLPVRAWLDEAAEAFAQVDVDPMWEHSMLTHPEVHR